MKTYSIQSMKRSGRTINFFQTEVLAASAEAAYFKRRKRAPTQRIISVYEKGSAPDLSETARKFMTKSK